MPAATDEPPAARAVAIGAGSALAVALPAAIAGQVLEAVRDEELGLVAYPLALAVLAGVALGGWVTGRLLTGAGRRAALAGAGAGLTAIALVLALGVARRAAAGEDVAWATVPAIAALAGTLGAAGGALGARQAARTRP